MNNKRDHKKNYWIGDPIELNEEDLKLLEKLNYDIKSNEPLPKEIARKFLLHKMFKSI